MVERAAITLGSSFPSGRSVRPPSDLLDVHPCYETSLHDGA